MVQPNTPINLNRKSQGALIEYYKQVSILQRNQFNMRANMERIDRAYMRETDNTEEHQRAKIYNRYGDSTRIQNITVPIVLPVVEAAVTYQTSVFLTGQPMFGVVSNPQYIDAALQMETVIEDQQIRGGWVGEFIKFFRDGFKYNLCGVEIEWARVVTATLETDLLFSNSQARPKEVIWEGNKVKRLDMYNTFFDSRVTPGKVHERGEFAGYTELVSRIELKQIIARLPDKMISNIIPAFESGLGTSGVATTAGDFGYYNPTLNPDALFGVESRKKGSINWLQWAGLVNGEKPRIQYKDMYEVSTLYARILPSDFGIVVPNSNTPQVWKFIVVNHSVPIYAERQTNAHGLLPILISQPLDDGLDFQTKSLADNVEPIQHITSALWNSNLAARRRAISDRGIYDPSRISEANINNANPAAKIPVRPAAYGKPVAEAYYPIPFRDDQASIISQETPQLMRMAEIISGQNPARQGQFVKGNKTRDEFQTVMANANGRDQTTSIILESQFFTPLKEIIKLNILQYQGGISLFNRNIQKPVKIDPVALRKAVLEFKISDGLIPSDKLIDGATLSTALQVIGSSPEISGSYNIGPMFSYLMKIKGADLSPFEKSPEQLAYEQALQQWQMAMSQVVAVLQKSEQQFDPKMLPPQPTPQQFGYDPRQQGTSPVVTQPAEVATRVNNITNNITNQESQ